MKHFFHFLFVALALCVGVSLSAGNVVDRDPVESNLQLGVWTISYSVGVLVSAFHMVLIVRLATDGPSFPAWLSRRRFPGPVRRERSFVRDGIGCP